jgi:hypothetical protein
MSQPSPPSRRRHPRLREGRQHGGVMKMDEKTPRSELFQNGLPPRRLSDYPEARHWFDFSREPPCFHEKGIMEAWCFVCCRWESWRLYGDSELQ